MFKHLNILLAEQDKDIASITKNFLVSRGYATIMCSNGEEALEHFNNERLDFVLIDVNIPVINGIEVTSAIRSKDDEIPVIFMGANPHQSDIAKAFNAGGDDFITLPFSMDELGLRIEAILKRLRTNERHYKVYKLGRYTLDTLHHVLIFNDKERRLTVRELDLLTLFCKNVNKVVERAKVLQHIWHTENYFNARNMDVYIRRLRNLLCDDPNVRLENVHGVGYKLVVL